MNMEFRLATKGDLPQLKTVYQEIIRDMDKKHIDIWDEIYPCSFFEEDIEHGRMYVLVDCDIIAAGFALCDVNAGSESVQWQWDTCKPLYFDRFGVNVHYAGRGVGSMMLHKAEETARSLGADSLRLFVVDKNVPAIRLYEKNGYTRAQGYYDEVIDESLVLRECGYEKAL